jgi:hypothetical protein
MVPGLRINKREILMERRKQTDCKNEPGYPGIDTVVFSMSAPDLTAHFKTIRCSIECPHFISECGEWKE